MASDSNEVVRSSIGSVRLCEDDTVIIECGDSTIEIPRTLFSSFVGMIDVAFANISFRGASVNNKG